MHVYAHSWLFHNDERKTTFNPISFVTCFFVSLYVRNKQYINVVVEDQEGLVVASKSDWRLFQMLEILPL